MTSGRTVLSSMEQAISQARSNEMQLDQTLRSAEAEAARLRQQRLEAFKALAEVKLDLMARNEFVGELDAAERRAQQLIRRHEQALAGLAGKRDEAARALEAAQAARHKRAEDLETAVHELDRLTAEAGAKAHGAAGWTAQQEAAAKAKNIAEEADKKADLAEADRDEKKKPYEADPLFMYLWQRKFGTGEYASGFFVRFFDRKVAALVGYQGARPNYHMLNEIPKRLRAHADRAAAIAKEETDKLAAMESAALEAAGGAALTEKVAAARAELEAAERELAGKRAALAAIEKQREAALKEDGDGAFKEAVALLAEADSKLDLRTLQAEAMRTATTHDENLVARIRDIDAAIARADQEVAQIRAEARELAQRRVEIERVRDNSRRQGYDNPFGTFQNGSVIGDVIGGVLSGALRGAILDQVLREGYRERSHHWEPDFGNRGSGGGGLNFPNWGGGSPGGGGSSSGSGTGWSGNWSDWIGSGSGSGGSSGGGILDSIADAAKDFTTDERI
jgi:hypothetical protein